jgi:hypothetical protein
MFATLSYLTRNVLFLQVLKCEYIIRGEIVMQAQMCQITYIRNQTLNKHEIQRPISNIFQTLAT